MNSERVGPDPRNKLNDLSGKEWIQLSKSWWYQKGLGRDHPDTSIEMLHPAPFSYKDAQKFIMQFTKTGMTVLDPFCGVASTQKAAALCGRNSIGIEISSKWVTLGKQRINREVPSKIRNSSDIRIVKGDCITRLRKIKPSSIDFILTSPPYWGILNKTPDHKVKSQRLDKGLLTKYSSSPSDLGNEKSYDVFLLKLKKAMKGCFRVLKPGKYMVIIVGDFRHLSNFYPFHTDVIDIGMSVGFSLQGINVLVQNNKNLYPYGYPYAFVQNIHHQYAIVFQRRQNNAMKNKKM